MPKRRRRLNDHDWVANLGVLILVGCTAVVVVIGAVLALHGWEWSNRSVSLISLLFASAVSLVASRRYRGRPPGSGKP